MNLFADSRLLVSVVRRGRGDRVVALAREAGAKGSTVLMGRGTAQNRILQLLCLADTEKELVFTVASLQEMPGIVRALRSAPDLCKKMPGIGFIVNVNMFFHARDTAEMIDSKARHENNPDNTMKCEFEHELICVIANAGFADDIMRSARAAGATGGTILKARGTVNEQDSSFFGITIVPEKEMVLILVKRNSLEGILAAVRNCPCLTEPGAGIVFCMPVDSFFPLGQNANYSPF